MSDFDDEQMLDPRFGAPPANSPLFSTLMSRFGASPRPDLAAQSFSQSNNPQPVGSGDHMLMAPSPYSPLNGMSTADKFFAGAGQGMTDAVQAGQQALADGNPLGLPPDIMDRVRSDLAAKAKRKKDIDQPLLDTDAGTAGSIAGQTAALSLLGPFRR